MSWNITFISEQELTDHVRATIQKYGDKLESFDLKRFNKNIVDPVKLIFDKTVYRATWEETISNEIFRQRDKANNNDIGYFHQRIFQYINHCHVPANGEEGGWDVIYENPDGIKLPDGAVVHKVYVEMKNKHISGSQLFQVADTFMKKFEGMFGDHVHILDFALHMDETTPHIHERHVFDCENKYGELCPQQEKALEALGISLPNPDKPRGRNNNRKMTFDLICRNLLFDICREQGLEIEEEPEYGGKKYLEKQEFIIQAQKEKIARQEQKIKDQEEKIMDNETLIDEVAEIAYDKAVEVVTEKVRVQTQEEDIRILDQLCNSIVQNPNNSDKAKTITKNVIKMAKDKLRNATKAVIAKVQKNLQEPEVRKTNTEQIKKKSRTSILEKLAANKKRIVEDAANKKNKTKYHDRNFL